jgi:predicted ferric reductase
MQHIVFLFATAAFGIHGADLVLLFGALLWIAMLADCLYFNARMNWKQKIPWLLVLIFVAPIGTLLYFLIAFMGRFLAPKEPHIPISEIRKGTYTSYEQGYQLQQQPVYQSSQQSPVTLEEQGHETSSHPLYEQPQATYPEMHE